MDIFIQDVLDSVDVSLDLEKYLKLKSQVMFYLVLTRDKEDINYVICTLYETLLGDEDFRTNNEFYTSLVVNMALEKHDVEDLINNYFNDGYLFHSFNGAFYSSIKERGLILRNKPWNLNELAKVKEIFSRHGKKNIFGLYQGEERTPIYLASNLNSSSYYGISSPTWFLHFVSGDFGDKDFDNEAYRNRDYNSCLKNVLKLCDKYKLSSEEKRYVVNFFDKYYNILGKNKEPKVIMIKRRKIDNIKFDFTRLEDENDFGYFMRLFNQYGQGNYMIKNNISKDDIYIINYERERMMKL